jgi:CheY-like chemotaxis protein
MGSERRRYVRIVGPFDALRVGLMDSPVTLYDLSEGGCFVNFVNEPPAAGRNLVLKINVPQEGWICLKAQALYAKPEFGFAVVFVEIPRDASDRLKRGLLRLQDLLPDSDRERSITLPSCPHCHGTSVRPLGMAGSNLPWFACHGCGGVWAARDEEVGPETQIADSTSVTQPVGAKQILIADDDGGVLALLQKALRDYGVLTGRDIAEAWAVGCSAPVDLLITDYLMPDGTGEELINRLRERQPSLKVLIMTGHGAMLDQEGFPWWTQERHLSKPFSVGDLRLAVMELIGAPYK